MKKRVTFSIHLALSLILLTAPLLGIARPIVFSSNRSPIKKTVTPTPNGKPVSVRKGEKPKVVPHHDPVLAAGQSATPLADGQWLLLGGEGDLMNTAAIANRRTGEMTSLTSKPSQPRAWHSATMLPDGTILIVGGIGAEGQWIGTGEIFNPETLTFKPMASTGLLPRAYHTATLTTDGRILIAGGSDAKGNLVTAVELWDPEKKSAVTLAAKLSAGRQKHLAALQADGSVLLSGGTDADGIARSSGEIYEPESQTFIWTGTPNPKQTESNAPRLEFSTPSSGAIDVDQNTRITLRFSKSLSVKTVNRENVVLQGPRGEVPTRVVAAEGGMLAFVTPLASLSVDSSYNLTINGVSDDDNRAVPFAALLFKTKQCPSNASGEKMCGAGTPSIDLDSWIPNAKNLRGDWSSERPDSPARSLPAIQAPAGETALAGQVLTLSGTPLPNVALQIGDNTVSTDGTGRLLLSALKAGRQVLTIQGHTASRPGKTYGTFDVLVDITAGKTTVLPYTIWLPVLDEQNAARLPIPTARETVVTTPRIPGMEVRIPSNAVLRLPEGAHQMHGMTRRELTSVAITPIPIDRPPFPLPPGVSDGLLFTLQLHGAKVEGLNGEKRPGMRFVFPNYAQLPAGTRVNFWNYDSQEAGWYMYGQGTVTPDRRQIVPDPGVELQSMHCISLMDWVVGAIIGPIPGNGAADGDPVDLGTGLFVYKKTDLVLPDVIPISLSRTYRQNDSVVRSFGKGATNPYDMYVWGNTASYGEIVLPDGGNVHFDRLPGVPGYVYEHTATPTRYYKATMRLISGVGPNGAWEVKLKDGTIYQFGIKVLWGDIFGAHISITGLSAIQDRYGNRLTVTRDDSFRMAKVISPNGRWVEFSYSDSSKRVAQATDNTGRIVGYTYDGGGRLWKVTDAKGGITEYTYDSSDRMLTIKDPRGIVYLTNEYDASGRVMRQTQADGGVFQFAYTVDGSNKITQTDVTDPRLNVRRTMFNSSGYTLTDTFALGKPEQQVFTYTRQTGSNLILTVTDPLARTTATTYDVQGNATGVTHLFGTPDAVTTTLTYEPRYNQIATVTDPLNHTVTYAYNGRGNLASITEALGHKTTFGYNPAAQLTTVSDALGHITQFSYDDGTLSTVTDPLGRIIRHEEDGAGRTTRMINPLGVSAGYQYDNLNRTTLATDPLDGNISLGYDLNGNVLNVADSRNSVTTYIYDNMDRVSTRRDPLLHDQTYQYDLNGNLKQTTDRKGQVTNYTYDPLNRLTQVAFADTSTRAYVYDAANRLTQVVDSQSGTINYGYDNMDRLTSATTSQGALSYTYDAAGRRTSMTVAGQPTVNYTYDNGNRLTQITQGSATVTIAYDAMGRRTSLTLPNGLVTQYGYDLGSQLISLTYKQGTNVIGDLTYEYDLAGRRTRVGGSFARSLSPLPVSSATYNAANQLLSFGNQALTHDLNGNLTSDGTNTYSWDARDRLISVTGPGTNASFQYDAAGRRSGKTVNGTTTSFLYDGSNIVQEQSAQNGYANLLNGGIDEVFSRNDAGGVWSRLTDGLSSSVALTDSNGIMQTEYSYGAFGQNASTGFQNQSATQYTGRENDGIGLQYNRARYYSPGLQRFISEDPAGMNGGINLYAYVNNSPTNFIDPQGLDIEVIIWNPTFLEGFNGLGGHVSYNIDGTMYSWEGHGLAAPQPAQQYIGANMQFRSGMGYEIDFGSAEKNRAFEDAIKHGYDGAPPAMGFPYPSSPYNLITNNCGNAFCNAANSGQFGLPPDDHITPWGHRDYIERYLPIKSRYYYPYLGGRSCAEYSTAPGGMSGFFGKLAGDIGNLYGY